MDNVGIKVGGVEKEVISELADSILKILAVPNKDNATIQIALKVLHRGVNTGNHTIVSDCNVTMDNNNTPPEASSTYFKPEVKY